MMARFFRIASVAAVAVTLGMAAGRGSAQPAPFGRLAPLAPFPARPTVRPQGPQQVDHLAHRLVEQTRQLSREVRLHYGRPVPHGSLIRLAGELEHQAEHLLETAHRHGSPMHLRADVRQLERTLDRLADMLYHADHGPGVGLHDRVHVRRELSQVRRLVGLLEDALRPAHDHDHHHR